MAVNPVTHANEVISRVRLQSDAAILFYSGGKDSICLLDLIAKRFDRVVCVFMYFVKDLEHITRYLSLVKRYPNVELLEVPHWILTTIHREGIYCNADPNIKVRTLADVDAAVRRKTGIQWAFYGMKQADGMHRRIMLRTYDDAAISHTNKVYPLTHWKKHDVLAYIKMHRLPKPIDYGCKTSSSGLTFDKDVFAWLREHHPSDLEKIYRQYPLSRQILFEYDNEVPKV
jgi:sulfate adenylyltransferase subunit 2